MFSDSIRGQLCAQFSKPMRYAELVIHAKSIMRVTRHKDVHSFVRSLLTERVVSPHQLTARNGQTATLFCSQPLDALTPYQVAQGSFPSGYFCNMTSAYYHSLTNQIPRSVYLCHESIPSRPKGDRNSITEHAIQSAFIKPPRHTKNVYDCNGHEIIVVARAKHTGYGVAGIRASGSILPKGARVTCVERALIDSVVSPHYNGGIASVYSYFINAKKRLKIAKLVHIYKQIDLQYPYSQSIGFLLDRAGMKSQAAVIMKSFPPTRNFFIDHSAKSSWKYDSKWRIHYPEGLVDEN